MSEPHYGFGTTNPSSGPKESTDLTADIPEVYNFERLARFCIVVNNYSSGKYLYGAWNAHSAATTGNDWDFQLAPGDVASSPPGIAVQRVALISPSEMAFGTDFAIRGWS